MYATEMQQINDALMMIHFAFYWGIGLLVLGFAGIGYLEYRNRVKEKEYAAERARFAEIDRLRWKAYYDKVEAERAKAKKA